MAVTKVFTLYGVYFDTTAIVATLFKQMETVAITFGNQPITKGGDGDVYNTYTALMSQARRISFTSTAIATLLGAIGLSGSKIDNNGVVLYFQALAKGGVRGGASTNLKLTIKEGLVIPRTINAPHGGVATITYEIIITYDGANEPVVPAVNQSLTGTTGVSELFTAGPVSINGSALDAIQDTSIDFGIEEIVKGGDGDVWPTYAAIMNISPASKHTVNDIDVINTYGLTGTAQDSSDSVIYLRKMDEGGTRVADATEQHISLTVDEGRIFVESLSASHGGEALSEVIIQTSYDGTNAPYVIDVTAAIV